MEQEKKVGLDFSVGEDSDNEVSLVFENNGPNIEKKKTESVKENSEGIRTEFTIPEYLDVKSASEKTYNPKFTNKAKSSSKNVQTSNDVFGFRDELAGLDYSIDPTAEPDSKIRMLDATLVNVTGTTSSKESYETQSTVFKFSVDEYEEEELLRVDEATLEPDAREMPENKESVKENVKIAKDKEYNIPDPFVHKNALMDTSNSNITLASNITVGDEQNKSKKKKREFNSLSERDAFKDKFLDAIMATRIRLIAAVIVSVLILITENLRFFGVSLPYVLGFESDGVVMAVIDLVFVFCMLALAIPECAKAFKWLVLGKAVPELFVPIGAIISLVYYVIVFVELPLDYPLFALAFALMVISSILASLIKKKADFVNFKNVSTANEKYIVDRKLTRSLPEENMATDGAVEGYKSKTARMFRTSFVTDFFKRSRKCSENSANIVVIIAADLAIAIVFGAVAFFVLDGFYSALMTFATVFMIGMPVFSVISHKTTFMQATKSAMEERSVFIGEATVFDYAGVDVLTFKDTDIFTDEDVSLQRIMLYGRSENLEKAMYQMSSIFATVGGPLSRIFADSIEYTATPAKNVRVEENGIVADVHGNQVRAGSLDYMVKSGITIPEDTSKDNSSLMSTKIMYAAENGEIYAKFYIRYTLSEEFTMIMPSLVDDGIVPLIYTRDPNVDSQLMRSLTAGADSIRVSKKLTLSDQDDKVHDRVSAGLVTTGDKLSVINMLLLAKRYVKFHKIMAVTELLAMAVGAGLAVMISLLEMTSAIPSACLSVWQIAWCIVFAVMSKRAIRSNVDYTKRD